MTSMLALAGGALLLVLIGWLSYRHGWAVGYAAGVQAIAKSLREELIAAAAAATASARRQTPPSQ